MIAFTTPTGTIGGRTLGNLLESSTELIRVLVRDRKRLSPEISRRVEIVEGSLDIPAHLHRLLDGARMLFWCQPDPHTAEDYLGAYETLARRGSEAVRATGVPRVVAVSAAGDAMDRSAGPISGLRRMEEILRGSGAACRFLRCGSFYENFRWQWQSITEQGVFIYPMEGTVKTPHVAAADIASVAAEWVSRNDWTGVETPHLLGPAPLGYREMAEILSAELGRSVVYERMEPSAYRELLISMGWSPDAAQGLVDMFAFLETGIRVPSGAEVAETRRPLRSGCDGDIASRDAEKSHGARSEIC